MEEEIKKRVYESVEHFLKKQQNGLYDEYEVEGILGCIKYGVLPDIYHKEIVREVLERLNLIPEEENIYSHFAREIEQIHSLEGRKIIEVGCGVFPHLAKKIRLKQTKGSVTVYDPRLNPALTSTESLILKREKFTRSTEIADTDLLVGLMPCKGAESIIDQAIDKKIDFIVWLCEGGPHGDYYDFYEDEDEWLCSVQSVAKRGIRDKQMGTYGKKLIKKYSDRYPIIYNNKK